MSSEPDQHQSPSSSMATPVRRETYCCKCPCGKGSIVNVFISYRSPQKWDRFKEIRCEKCDREWIAIGNFLEEILPPDPKAAPIRSFYKIATEIAKIGRLIVDSKFSFDSPIARIEWNDLKAGKLCELNLSRYQEKRDAGVAASALCQNFHLHTKWLLRNCRNPQWRSALKLLIAEEARRPPVQKKRTIRIDELPSE